LNEVKCSEYAIFHEFYEQHCDMGKQEMTLQSALCKWDLQQTMLWNSKQNDILSCEFGKFWLQQLL